MGYRPIFGASFRLAPALNQVDVVTVVVDV